MDKIVSVVILDNYLGDPSDPDLIVVQLIDVWLNTEQGRWVRDHSVSMQYQFVDDDQYHIGLSYILTANFTEANALLYKLKYRRKEKNSREHRRQRDLLVRNLRDFGHQKGGGTHHRWHQLTAGRCDALSGSRQPTR